MIYIYFFSFQTRLLQKLGEGARPFTLSFPPSAPNSVLIRGEDGDSAQMGVTYDVRIHIGDSSEDYTGMKKSSVHMSIRKVNVSQIFFAKNSFSSSILFHEKNQKSFFRNITLSSC